MQSVFTTKKVVKYLLSMHVANVNNVEVKMYEKGACEKFVTKTLYVITLRVAFKMHNRVI